jgi:hypothetical protein
MVPGNPLDGLAPKARGLENVRLVDRGHMRGPRPALGPPSRRVEGHPGDSLDLRGGVLARVVGPVAVAPAVAEVDTPRQLAHDEEVRALDQLGTQGARAHERGAGSHRPQVRVQPEALAQSEQPLLGARGAGIGGVPPRPADGAQEHRVRFPTRVEHLIRQRRPVRVYRGAADGVLSEVEVRDGIQEPPRGRDDLGSDAVAREQHDSLGGHHPGSCLTTPNR